MVSAKRFEITMPIVDSRLSWMLLLVFATTATAMPPELTPRQFLDICRSTLEPGRIVSVTIGESR